jgi:HSP20 family molecular chaperone IbpA
MLKVGDRVELTQRGECLKKNVYSCYERWALQHIKNCKFRRYSIPSILEEYTIVAKEPHLTNTDRILYGIECISTGQHFIVKEECLKSPLPVLHFSQTQPDLHHTAYSPDPNFEHKFAISREEVILNNEINDSIHRMINSIEKDKDKIMEKESKKSFKEAVYTFKCAGANTENTSVHADMKTNVIHIEVKHSEESISFDSFDVDQKYDAMNAKMKIKDGIITITIPIASHILEIKAE